MVLEEINRAQDGSQDAPFSESLPSNDADPYAGDHSPTIVSGRSPKYIAVNSPPYQVYVNLDNVPQPLLGWRHGPASAMGGAIRDTCKQASDFLGRPVNQQEADALAFHLGRGFKVAGYGAPAGMAVGTYLAYRGWSKMRFPGWTPGEKWNLDKFGVLRGPYARAMWHVGRFNAYWIVGVVAGTIFFSSYGLTVGSAGRMMDPRLKELSEVLRERAKSGGKPIPGSGERDHTAGPRSGETMDMAKQRRRAQEAQDAWRRRREEATSQSSASTRDDDMSPTGGAFGAEYVDLGSANVTDAGMMSDDQARRSSERLEAQQRADYAERTEPPRATPQSRPQRAESSSQTSQTESTPKSSGSAWERLRQQAASGSQQQASSRSAGSSRSSSSIDSFAFSSSDEEKQLARGEAQRDFDARLELERQGKDFDDRSSGRRW